MKTNRSIINGLVVCAVALAMASTLTAQTVAQVKARVVRIQGYARFTSGNNVWQKLKVGEMLRAGTIIQTSLEKGSFVDLVLEGGAGGASAAAVGAKLFYQPNAQQNVVRLWENTLLGLDKLTSMETGADVVTETELDLKAGRILGSVKKLSAASSYNIKLPNGIAGIRGTVFSISADGSVKVSSGMVVIAFVSADGKAAANKVEAGQQFDPRAEPGSQITPLSGPDVQGMLNPSPPLTIPTGPSTRTPGVDQTIYPVSPVGN
jgi:hypothetical protein